LVAHFCAMAHPTSAHNALPKVGTATGGGCARSVPVLARICAEIWTPMGSGQRGQRTRKKPSKN